MKDLQEGYRSKSAFPLVKSILWRGAASRFLATPAATLAEDMGLCNKLSSKCGLRERSILLVLVSAVLVLAPSQVVGQAPNPPTGVTVTSVTTTSIYLSWTAPSNDIVGYSIYRCEQGSGVACTPAWLAWVANTGDTPPAPTTYSDSGLSAETTYRYSVTSNNAAYTESAKSSQVTGTTGPSPPTGLTATAVPGSISLSWTAPSNNIVGYSIYRCEQGGGAACTPAWMAWVADPGDAPPAPTTYVDTNVGSGKTYRYEATSNNAAYAPSDRSGQATATAVATPPTNLRVTQRSASTIGLTWDAPADIIHVAVDGYNLLRCEEGDTPCTPELIHSPSGTGFTDNAVTSEVNYRYAVQARRGGVSSPMSNQVTALAQAPPAPNAPTSLRASPISGTAIRLDWDAPVPVNDGNGVVDGYNLLRCVEGSTPCTPVSVNWVGGTSHMDGGLTSGTNYRYAVQSTRLGVSSTSSNEVTAVAMEPVATDGPGVPTDPSATVGEGGITLSWTAPSDDIAGYSIYRCEQGEGDACAPEWKYWVANEGDAPPAPTTYLDADVVAGATYRYEVTSNDAAYAESGRSAQVTATADSGTMPSAGGPSFAEGAEIGDLVFTVGESIEPLTLPLATGGDVDAALNDGGLSDYSFDPAELPAGLVFDRFSRELSGTPEAAQARTAYTYWVHDDDDDYSAEDADSIAFSITLESGTAPPTGDGPGMPTDPSATAGEGGITLSWTAPSDDIAGYSIYRCEQGEGDACAPEWKYWVANEGDAPPAPTTYLDADVVAGATYRYEVTSNDAAYAESGRSAQVTATADSGTMPSAGGPSFAEGAEIGDLVFTVGESIEPLTLPLATGGDVDAALNDGGLSDYSFDPAELPAGLVFDRFSRELSGTPEAAQARTAYTYWVHDDDDDYSAEDADSIVFSITIDDGELPDAGSTPHVSSIRRALAGFGRTVASDAVDLVESRVRGMSARHTRNQMAWSSHQLGVAEMTSTDVGHNLRVLNSETIGVSRYGQPWSRDAASLPAREGSLIGQLAGSSLEYRLDSAEDADPNAGWRFWARGSLSEFDSDSNQQVSLRGSTESAYLGMDYGFGKQGMLGGALSRSSGTVDYRNEDAEEGELDMSLVTGFQYGAWAPSDEMSLWGMFGIGQGELELSQAGIDQGGADVAFQMGAVGAHKSIASLGGVNWAAKADAFYSRLASDSIPDPLSDRDRPLLPSIEASTWHLSAMMEAGRTFQLSEQALATPRFEFGFIREGGDFEEDYFGEVGGDLVVSHSGLGLEVEAAIRAQASGDDRKFDDWSASLTLSIDPGADGTGLAFSLAPVWGLRASGAATPWQERLGLRHALHKHASGKDRPLHSAERVDLRLSYGFGLLRGLLTPFGQFSGAKGDVQRIRIGGQLQLDLRGGRSLPGGLQLEFAYEAADEQGIFLTLRHRLH